MIQSNFASDTWESWDLDYRPVIPDGMPVLIDDDLLFEDEGRARPSVAVNRWLRELPSSGVPAPNSWPSYARAVREWSEHLAKHGIGLFDERGRLKAALSSYAVLRSHGPADMRFEDSTWNQHVSILSLFYRWAADENLATAVPFTYRQAVASYGDQKHVMEVNAARRRTPKPHVTIRHLEPDFLDLFLKALGGLDPDGRQDTFHGRELMRNAAVGRMVVATGLRRQEFTYLLAIEVPPLPRSPRPFPIPFPVPGAITKGSKFRTTWISYEALAEVHQYLSLVRPLTTGDSRWSPPTSWGEPLVVSQADPEGGRVNGVRRRWDTMRPQERRRLVAPGGGSMLLSVKPGGGPFSAWPTVFARTAERIRERYEPRFPHVYAHRLRHTFAMREMENLVMRRYEQSLMQVPDQDFDAALKLYVRNDPLLVLRDLLGHSSAMTTEMYLMRLDPLRIYAEYYARAAAETGGRDPVRAAAAREAAAEFDGEDEI